MYVNPSLYLLRGQDSHCKMKNSTHPHVPINNYYRFENRVVCNRDNDVYTIKYEVLIEYFCQDNKRDNILFL